MSILVTALLMLALLLIKGFFSGSELGLISADRVRLRLKAREDHRGAKLALRLLNEPARFLTTTLLGTNISSIALTTVGTLLMIGLLGAQGELVALILFAPLFLIIGEIVPKSVYQQKADRLAPVIAYPLIWMQTILAPLVWLFSAIAGLVVRLFGSAEDPSKAAREQLIATVQMAEKTGALEAFSRGQVRRVLRYAQMTVADAMWPLDKIRCADRQAPMGELIAIRRATAQRLIPLIEQAPNRIAAVAVLESWDLLDPDLESRAVDDFLSRVQFVPEPHKVSEIIEILHDDPKLTIIVVDANGTALGLITLNLLVRRTLGVRTDPLTDRALAQ